MLEKLILFFVFFLPFQFALQPSTEVDLALARVLAIVIFFWWVAASLFQRRFVLPKPLPLFFFLAFIFWAAMSLVWAENVNWALRKLFFLLSFFPLFLVFDDVLRNLAWREKILSAWITGAFGAALVALAQFFAQWVWGVEKILAFWTQKILPVFLGAAFSETVANYPSLLVNISGRTALRASAFFPDPHIASLYFGMSLPFALWLAWKNVGTRQKYFGICTLVIFWAGILTFSRGGYFGLIFGAIIFFSGFFLRGVEWKKHIVKIGAGVLVVIAILISPAGTRFITSFSADDGSKIERERLWREAIDWIVLRPVGGVGLGNYSLAVKPSASYREPFYAHNLFLDIAVETGLIGLVFFTAFLLLGIRSLWKKWKQDANFLALAALSSLVIFVVHSFFETPIFSVHILPAFLWLIAMSVSLQDEKKMT